MSFSVHEQIPQDVTFPKIYAYMDKFLVVIKPQVFLNVHTYFLKKSRSVKVKAHNVYCH